MEKYNNLYVEKYNKYKFKYQKLKDIILHGGESEFVSNYFYSTTPIDIEKYFSDPIYNIEIENLYYNSIGFNIYIYMLSRIPPTSKNPFNGMIIIDIRTSGLFLERQTKGTTVNKLNSGSFNCTFCNSPSKFNPQNIKYFSIPDDFIFYRGDIGIPNTSITTLLWLSSFKVAESYYNSKKIKYPSKATVLSFTLKKELKLLDVIDLKNIKYIEQKILTLSQENIKNIIKILNNNANLSWFLNFSYMNQNIENIITNFFIPILHIFSGYKLNLSEFLSNPNLLFPFLKISDSPLNPPSEISNYFFKLNDSNNKLKIGFGLYIDTDTKPKMKEGPMVCIKDRLIIDNKVRDTEENKEFLNRNSYLDIDIIFVEMLKFLFGNEFDGYIGSKTFGYNKKIFEEEICLFDWPKQVTLIKPPPLLFNISNRIKQLFVGQRGGSLKSITKTETINPLHLVLEPQPLHLVLNTPDDTEKKFDEIIQNLKEKLVSKKLNEILDCKIDELKLLNKIINEFEYNEFNIGNFSNKLLIKITKDMFNECIFRKINSEYYEKNLNL
jgi:hypothetical protein